MLPHAQEILKYYVTMFDFHLAAFLEGLAIGAALIIAIGAQNAFVLKQGILRNHVFIIALICALIDSTLIIVGVSGLGLIFATNKIWLSCAKWGGAAFLVYYGFKLFKAVFENESLKISQDNKAPSLKVTVITLLALSLLNPHVYLDTVVLLGSIGAQFASAQRPFFIIGAVVSSFTWFFSLSYGAKYLIPFFQRPLSWKILDFIAGIVMWAIAVSLFL